MKCPARDLLARRPERLVVSGYRNMMAAYELSDASCWEAVWSQFICELGATAARRTVGELQYWARTIRVNAVRPPAFFPSCCLQLCYDECMAVSMIAAAQAGDAEAGLLSVSLVTGGADGPGLQEIWQAAAHLGTALKVSGLIMYPVPCTVIRSIHAKQMTNANQPSGRLLN